MRWSFAAALLIVGCGPAEMDTDGGASDGGADSGPPCDDSDGDGASSQSCGGDDCDDANADVFPGAAEICNTVDDDCDGTIDGAPASAACPVDFNQIGVCEGGTCAAACALGFLDCDGVLGCERDANDEASCGACNHACLHSGCDSGVCTNDYVEVSVGSAYACARRGSGSVECWGINMYGQLGDGTMVERDLPVVVADAQNDFVEIAAGYSAMCARRASGRVACWGRNNQGQLGNGTFDDSAFPVAVEGITDAVEVSTGQYHACARLSAGTVMCWGENSFGQLGGADAGSDSNVPVAVLDLDDAIRISAGGTHTCAIRASGQLVCWGDNTEGQLGDGTTTSRAALAPVSLADVRGVSAGFNHTCARDANTVWCWGANLEGQLGTGATSMRRAMPVMAMTGLPNAVAVSAGAYRTCARGALGIVACWGSGSAGALGDGMGSDSPVGVRVMGLSDAVQLSAGFDSSCALRETGGVVCWGRNAFGEIGDGSGADAYTPAAVYDP